LSDKTKTPPILSLSFSLSLSTHTRTHTHIPKLMNEENTSQPAEKTLVDQDKDAQANQL